MFSAIKNHSGLGVIELTILICSLVAALGGGYIGMNQTKQQPVMPGVVPEGTQEVIIIDLSGQQHDVILEKGKAYNVTVTPDGKLTIEEKK